MDWDVVCHDCHNARVLQTECDKLRSVLEQKAQSAASPTVQQKVSKTSDELRTELQQKAHMLGQEEQGMRAKKLAVSAEPAKLDAHPAKLEHYKKSAG